MSDFERELGWDDQIENEGEEFEPLPEGDYKFTVKAVERARSKGEGKLPPCNMAKVTITVHGERDRDIVVNFLLYSSLEWKLSQFFLSIGMKKHGEPLRMNWPGSVSCSGNCHVTVRTFKMKNGGEGKANDISKFYPYDEVINTVQPTTAQPTAQYVAQPTAQYAAQPTAPTTQPTAPTAGGWKAGSF